jgi:hypothetical protein
MLRTVFTAGFLTLSATMADATVIAFDNTDFTVTPEFNRLRDFSFRIDIDAVLVAGQTYANPMLNSVDYAIFGILDTEPTPSGFGAFDLRRTGVSGTEFYGQGSSFDLGISASADLSDGLQMSELSMFVLNAREDDTGRYHPAILTFASDGTGFLQNSDNSGGINPGNGMEVDVDTGAEYQVSLSADPSLTLAMATVPLPAPIVFLGAGLLGLIGLRRRTQKPTR